MSLVSKLKQIFSRRAVLKIKEYVAVVYPIVEFIASVTPTKADDQILLAANRLGVKGVISGSIGAGQMLKDIAIQAAQKQLPKVPVEVIARLVESAYQQMKANDILTLNGPTSHN
jgi:hypothetical protein